MQTRIRIPALGEFDLRGGGSWRPSGSISFRVWRTGSEVPERVTDEIKRAACPHDEEGLVALCALSAEESHGEAQENSRTLIQADLQDNRNDRYVRHHVGRKYTLPSISVPLSLL